MTWTQTRTLGLLLAPLFLFALGSCAVLSDNLPLIPPAAFANAVYAEQPDGAVDIEVEMTYWKSAAPFFVYGFARTELSNRRASGSDFRNMWDRDWTRLLPLDGSRPKAFRQLDADTPKAFLNFYMIVWESTTGSELAEHRFCGSKPVGDAVNRFKLSSCD
jgi:hypothetical protein